MVTWTDCPARTPEQQIIFAQLEILRRLDSVRLGAGHSDSGISLPAGEETGRMRE
jgi:hypothetical protein